MRKERHKAVPAVYLILKKGDEILLMKRQGSDYYDDWYSLPAGHVEEGELPREALIRETAEELGIDIKPKNVHSVHTMYRTKHDETGDRMDLFFLVKKWSGKIINREPHRCNDIRWFPIKNLPKKMMPHTKKAIQNIEKGVIYSEYGD